MTKKTLADAIFSLDEKMVESICWDVDAAVVVSSSKIRRSTHAKLFGEKKRAISNKVAIAMCCILIMTVPGYALVNLVLDKPEVVNDENKHLIGTEINDDYYIILDEDGICRDSKGNEGTLERIMSMNTSEVNQSRLVESIDDETLMPSSYLEVPAKGQLNNKYSYPKVIMINNSSCILTDSNGAGWKLKEGDCITYKYEKAESVTAENQTMLIGYIHDGVMQTGRVDRDMTGDYSFVIKEKGVYYIWILSTSSDYQTIMKHSVKIKHK